MNTYVLEYKLEKVRKKNRELKKENKRLKKMLECANNKIARLNKEKNNTSEVDKIRRSKEYKEFRRKILERDGNKCVKCGSNNRLQVHHIKPVSKHPELIMVEGNVVTLCIKCHSETSNFFVT